MRSVMALLMTAATVGTLFVPAPVDAGDDGSAARVSAPGCRARYLVPPNPLNVTNGMALDGKGGLYVTPSLSNRIVRVDLQHPEKVAVIADETDRGYRSVVATGLPTKTVGIGVPLMNYSSDVLVRRDGTVVVSGASDGRLVERSC